MNYNLDKAAEHYFDKNDVYANEIKFRSIAIVENLIDQVSNKDILDLGLGHGFIHETLSKEAKSYTIIEGSKDLINNYLNNRDTSKDNFTITHSYFENFKPDKDYDIIMINGVLGHVENPVDIIKQYKGYLKKDGKIFITVQNANSLNRLIGFEANLLKDIRELSDELKNRGHRRYFTLDDITKDINESGLKIIKTEGLFLKPITSSQMVQLGFDENIFKALLKIGKIYPELCAHLHFECELI